MRPRIVGEATGAGMLRAYIESNLAFMGDYRNHVAAIVEVALNARDADGSRLFGSFVLEARATALGQLLASFQAGGEFREDFDPAVMAVAIRAAIDAVPPRLARDPGFDVGHYGRELAEVFDRATRGPDALPRTLGR